MMYLSSTHIEKRKSETAAAVNTKENSLSNSISDIQYFHFRVGECLYINVYLFIHSLVLFLIEIHFFDLYNFLLFLN